MIIIPSFLLAYGILQRNNTIHPNVEEKLQIEDYYSRSFHFVVVNDPSRLGNVNIHTCREFKVTVYYAIHMY